jgi:L-lactate utilization protein LutB
MESMHTKRNELFAEKVIKALESRNHEAYYAASAEAALAKALELIPEGSSVGWGGSMTTEAIGLNEAVRKGNYNALDRDAATNPEERAAIIRSHNTADFFLTSSNALTEDGIMVNIDGTGNRVSCLSFGPENIIMVISMNKIVKTLDDAMNRAKYTAAPINAQRFDINTPCKVTGACADCKSPNRICCSTLITSYSPVKGRFKVILVNDELGY